MTAARKKIPLIILFGGLAGLGMILFTIGTYKNGPQVFISNIVFLMYLIPIGLAIVAAQVEKKRNGGYLAFRSALRICFGIIVLSLAMQTIFNWALLHLIDPAFARTLRPFVLANTEARYRHLGMPEEDIVRNIDVMKNDPDLFSLGSGLLGLIRIYYLVGFIVSLVLAALLRRQGNPAKA